MMRQTMSRSDAQVPLFSTRMGADGQRKVAGLEQVFQSRLNPGNSLLVVINVSPVLCSSAISGPDCQCPQILRE